MAEMQETNKRRVGFWRWVWRITAGTFAVLVVMLALFIGLFRVAVPLLPDFQQRIETAATGALGYPIKVGKVDARWRLHGPELLFEDVVVQTKDNQRTLLVANRLRVAIDTKALIRGGAITPSALTLAGIEVELKRDVAGVWHVQDLPLNSLRSDQPVLAAWGVGNGAFGIQNLVLTIKDESRDTSFVIPDIDLDVTVRDSLLTVAGELELQRREPRIEFSLDAAGRADSLDQLVWTGFASAQRLDWSAIEPVLPEPLAWSTQEPLDLSLWVRATGNVPDEANVTINAKDVSVVSSGDTVSRVVGQFSWSVTQNNWQLNGENVDISSTPESVPGNLSVGTTSREEGKEYRFSASELNLEQLALLAAPASDELQTWITDYAPQGQVSDLQGFATLSENELVNFEIAAQLNNVGFSGPNNQPGMKGIQGRLYGGLESGGLELNALSTLSLPGVLREDVVFDAAEADISWVHQDEQTQITIGDVAISNSDLAATGTINLDRKEPQSAWISDIDLAVTRLNLKTAYRYYPKNKFSAELLKWLDGALLDGNGTNGTFKMSGPLNKFPFRNPDDGDFKASVEIDEATMHYADDWPDVTELDAQITFDRASFNAVVQKARLLTLSIDNAQARIEDLKSSVVFVESALDAPLDDMRAFLDATPIDDEWGPSWPDAQFYGSGAAQLNLTLPTKQLSETQYDVALQFDDSQFLFRDWPQTVSALSGEIRATRAGLSGSGIRGSFLGQPVEIEVEPATAAGFFNDITLKGVATPSSLARNLHESLADHLSGSAQWTALLSLPELDSDTPLQVRLRSPLQGMAITLPQPLAKQADTTRFMDALMTVVNEEQLALRADYGDDTNVTARVVRQSDGFWHVPRAELRFGGGAANLPESDVVQVMGAVSELDMSAIVDFTKRYTSSRSWVSIDQAELAVSELRGLKQQFGATTLGMVQDARGYSLNFVGDRLSGELIVPATISPESPIVGQFESLQWSSTDDNESIDPREAPSIRAVVDNFSYNEYELGALVAHLEARENLVAVREFTTTAADYNTRTTGSWVFGNDSSSTYLVSELKSTNVRSTLTALGLAEFMEASDATARLEMSWPGGWTPDYLNTMEAELNVRVGQGKLISVDPGAGRVFGLLSIGALPRRLNLDFRDVFDSGFGFDSIVGDFVINDGNAVTENLALSGPAANVVIVGRTGLVDKDYDQNALVYANFGSSLPIAGAIAGGPAVGAALLVFSEIFRKPLQNMGKVSYSITGSWDEPVVARTGSARPTATADEAGDTDSAQPAESTETPAESTPESAVDSGSVEFPNRQQEIEIEPRAPNPESIPR